MVNHPGPPQARPHHAHPPHGHPPHAPHAPHVQPPRPPAVPEHAGDFRRWFSATTDCLLVFSGAWFITVRLLPRYDIEVDRLLALAVCVFGLSFVHHVLGTWLFRATIGKFLFRMRVVREADAGRPRLWQCFLRWLLGLTWLPMQPLRSLIGADGDPYEDGCGLRYVALKDLRRAAG